MPTRTQGWELAWRVCLALGFDDLRGGLIRIDPATGAGTFIGLTFFTPVSGLTKLP